MPDGDAFIRRKIGSNLIADKAIYFTFAAVFTLEGGSTYRYVGSRLDLVLIWWVLFHGVEIRSRL